jgi:hypothetical protein
MIHSVSLSVVEALNEFIKNELSLQENIVVLTNPVDMKGSSNSQIENKLCVFLQHLEEERITKNGPYQSIGGTNPPIHFNLNLMFIANFPDPNYLEALRYISLVIEFFQSVRVFNKSNLPMLSPNVDKITMEYVNLDIQQLSNVWSLIGLKYMPSVIYKLRLLSFTNFLVPENSVSFVGESFAQSKFNSENLDEAAKNASSFPSSGPHSESIFKNNS